MTKSTFWMTAQEAEDYLKSLEPKPMERARKIKAARERAEKIQRATNRWKRQTGRAGVCLAHFSALPCPICAVQD